MATVGLGTSGDASQPEISGEHHRCSQVVWSIRSTSRRGCGSVLGIMDKSFGPFTDDVRALREDVHELDVKIAKVGEYIKNGSLLAGEEKSVGPLFTVE